MPHSTREFLLALLSVFLVLALGVFAVALKRTQQELDSMTYFLTVRTGEFHRMIQRLTESLDTSTPAPSETEGWKTYRNEEYGFEVRYPVEYMIKTFDVGDEMGLEEVIDIVTDSVKVLQIRVTDLDKYLLKTNTPTPEEYQDLFLRKLSNSQEIIINDVPAFQYEVCGRAACHWQVAILRNKLEFRIFEPLDVNDAMGKLADGRFPILSIVRSIRFVK